MLQPRREIYVRWAGKVCEAVVRPCTYTNSNYYHPDVDIVIRSPVVKVENWRHHAEQACMLKLQELGYSASQLTRNKKVYVTKPKHERHPDERPLF